ncbi:kti12, chromatin associated [Rhodotorula toruloides]
MAMVTVCGYPCSGKTARAHQLASFLEHRLNDPATPARHRSASKVVLVNDESLGISKAAYDGQADTRAEKPARAALFSAVQRSLARDTVVVVDAMNYIKGSRYQMYCAAREIGVRTCTVFIATSPEKCREWNSGRAESSRYAEATLDNLISRFEEPNSAARWDSPLITLASDDPALDSRPYEGRGTRSEAAERIWMAITEGEIKPPNVATQVVHTSSTSYLTLLDSASSSLITSLLSLQSLSPLSGPTTLTVPLSSSPPTQITLNLPSRPLTMPMLQRLKRQFVQLHARTASRVEFGEAEVVRMFGQYLGEQLR